MGQRHHQRIDTYHQVHVDTCAVTHMRSQSAAEKSTTTELVSLVFQLMNVISTGLISSKYVRRSDAAR